MLIDLYKNITAYLTATLGSNFIYLTVVFTTAFFIGYFVLFGYTVTRLDKRYFIRNQNKGQQNPEQPNSSTPSTPIRKVLILGGQIIKISVGVCLVISGIAMLLLPGQGLITILIGLSLLPFPHKSKIEQNLLERKSVRASLNWIRIKAKKEPFIFH